MSNDDNSKEPNIDLIDYLNIRPQYSNHCEAGIKGTREGLLRLQQAINSLISRPSSGESASATFTTFASDGEGYEVKVEMLPAKDMQEQNPFYVWNSNTDEV